MFWCISVLGGIGLVLHIAARFCHLSGARRAVCLFGDSPWLPRPDSRPLDGGEDVSFRAADGLTLRGTYLRAKTARREGVLVCCHELNGNRWTLGPMVESLRRQGFDVLAYDQRNHGKSDSLPKYQPTPLVSRHDADDLRCAIEHVTMRSDADTCGVGLVGVSKGALTALFVAADDPRVRGVVVDSACLGDRIPPFLRRLHRRHGDSASLGGFLRSISHCAERLARAWRRLTLGWWCGCQFVDLHGAVRRLRKPVLWIQGKRDPFLRVDPAIHDQAGLHGRDRVWLVDGADHAEAIEVAGDEYGQRVFSFFSCHLAPAAGASVPQPLPAVARMKPAVAAAFRKA